MTVWMEFAVQMKCQSCADKITSNLKDVDGINGLEVILEKEIVLIETSLPSSVIKDKIESLGKVAVLNGYGRKSDFDKFESTFGKTPSAVAMLGGQVGYSSSPVQGVVRFIQKNDSDCIVDGTIDGLSPGLHGLHLHECGDISRGCESVGDHFDLKGNANHGGPNDEAYNRHTGDLGNIQADEMGRAVFRLEDKLIKVWDIIGRSIVVTENQDDLGKSDHPLSTINGNSGNRLACGIISRSAGLFENSKKICACDGVTIWDERNKPLAGPGRRESVDTPLRNEASQKQVCSAF